MTGKISRQDLINNIQKSTQEFKKITKSTKDIKSSTDALKQLEELNKLQESTKNNMDALSGRGINFKFFQRSKTKNTNKTLEEAQSTLKGIELVRNRILEKYAEISETEERTSLETPMKNAKKKI